MHADHAMLFTDVADITKKQQRQLIQVTEKIADIYDREWDIANNFCSLLSEIAPREVWNNCSGIQGNSRLFGSKSSEFARNVRGLDLFIVVMVISELCKWQYINWIIIVIIIICPRSLGVKAKQMLERLHFILGVVWAKILKPEIALYVERRCKWKSLTRWSSVCDAPLQFSFTKCLVNHCCE